MPEEIKQGDKNDPAQEYNEESLRQEIEAYRQMQIRFCNEEIARNPKSKEDQEKSIEELKHRPEDKLPFFDNVSLIFQSISPLWRPEFVSTIRPERMNLYEDCKEIVQKFGWNPKILQSLRPPFLGEQRTIIRTFYIELRKRGYSRDQILDRF